MQRLDAVFLFEHQHGDDKDRREQQQYCIEREQYFTVGKVGCTACGKWKISCMEGTAGQCEII